jgi:hypothetical protein
VHALLGLGGAVLGRARVQRMQPWQRTLHYSVLSTLGVLIGWPLGYILIGGSLEQFVNARGLIASAVLFSILIALGLQMHWSARQRQLDAEKRAAEASCVCALRRLLGSQPRAQPPLRYIRASAGEITHQVDVHDVLFFQANEKYTCVHTAHGEHLIRTDPGAGTAARPRRVLAGASLDLDQPAVSRRYAARRGQPPVVAPQRPCARAAGEPAYVHLFRAM